MQTSENQDDVLEVLKKNRNMKQRVSAKPRTFITLNMVDFFLASFLLLHYYIFFKCQGDKSSENSPI